MYVIHFHLTLLKSISWHLLSYFSSFVLYFKCMFHIFIWHCWSLSAGIYCHIAAVLYCTLNVCFGSSKKSHLHHTTTFEICCFAHALDVAYSNTDVWDLRTLNILTNLNNYGFEEKIVNKEAYERLKELILTKITLCRMELWFLKCGILVQSVPYCQAGEATVWSCCGSGLGETSTAPRWVAETSLN